VETKYFKVVGTAKFGLAPAKKLAEWRGTYCAQSRGESPKLELTKALSPNFLYFGLLPTTSGPLSHFVHRRLQFTVVRPDSSHRPHFLSIARPIDHPACMRLFSPRLFPPLHFTTAIRFSSAERSCFSTSSHFNRFQLSVRKPLQSTAAMAPPMTTKAGKPLDKDLLESLLKRRLFFTPAFEIHAPVKGLFGQYILAPLTFCYVR
jgi:hypothetical protein